MSNPIRATRDRCSAVVEVHPPNLPPTGGCASFGDDPVAGWQVLEFTCGSCWAARRSDWTCVRCGDASYELALTCRGCGQTKPGLAPYAPNWDLRARDERESKREAEAMISEAIQEFGWAAVFGRARGHDPC